MKTQGFNPDYLLPGTRIGAYVVRTQIGYGGSSTVYEVESAEENTFALKMCRHMAGPHGSAEWRMDRRQNRNIVCLENLRGVRNVARIFAHDRYPDTLRGHQYLVQELVPGGLTITEWVKRESPSLLQIVAALLQLAELCGELAYADIRHRDLKPANILVTPDGVPKVVDFDSAICFRAEPLTREAASGQPGSHGYLCPELCLAILKEDRTGEKEAFEYLPWSDLHGLGVVFYEVLTGAHPFNLALQGYQMLQQIAHEEPAHPMRLNEAVPFGLNKVVMKLLVKNPLERYQHGDRVADDLRALLENVADESWGKPFRWADDKLERPSHVTAAGAKAVAPLTGKEAPPPTPLPNFPGPEKVLPRPVLALASLPPRRPSLRRQAALAAVLLMSIAGWLADRLVWSPPSSPPKGPTLEATLAATASAPVKGATVSSLVSQPSPVPAPPKKISSKARRAVAAVTGATLAAACAGCTGVKVRPEDELEWLASCPAEARETVRTLRLYPGSPNEEGPAKVWLNDGPNVSWTKLGCLVREGTITATAATSPAIGCKMVGEVMQCVGTTLVGTVREGSDRVYFRFHELRLADGRKFPICGIGATDFQGHGPGVAKSQKNGVPVPSPIPGYIKITGGRFGVRLAPYIPQRSQEGAKVN